VQKVKLRNPISLVPHSNWINAPLRGHYVLFFRWNST